uniref:histone acetyltransferase n=1 Tax=Phytophthora ramorum TaxID=164328 RepID=H3H008_PHYRM
MAATEATTKRPAEEAAELVVVKRVRFACSVSSTDTTSLAIAIDAEQVEAQTLEWFAPKFTYHAFGTDEVVDGYEGLKMSVTFSGFDFRALLDVKFKEKEEIADDVVGKLTPSLPKGFLQSRDEFVAEKEGEDGAVERHFETYECTLEDNEPAQHLLANLQTLSLWFIEDPRWVVYLVYERTEAGRGAFRPVGFITVFKFFNPLGRKAPYCKPEQNETHRICQALIFPTYQRQGHAERLVHCIHAQAVANEHVYELTVEDPVPAFSSLRDLVDLKNCVSHEFFSLPPDVSEDVGGTGRGTAALTTADIHAVQEKLKLTHKQVQTCYEAGKLAFVDPSDEAQRKKFRLEVKKRLFLLHREELDGMGSADRRKAFLEAEYQRLEAHYLQMLAKIGRKPKI